MKKIKEIDLMIEKAVKNELEVSAGEYLILTSYDRTINKLDAEHLVIKDIVWECDQQDMIDTLRKFNIEKVIIADSSSALMGLMHFLIDEGCVIEGTTIVNEKEDMRFGGDKGLVIKISQGGL